MEYRYFNINSITTIKELKSQYKKQVLKYHVDKIGDRLVSKEEYLRRERVMSEINTEYARLRKTFSVPGPAAYNDKIKKLQKLQTDIIQILEEIPDETKTEIKQKARDILLTQWQQKIEPFFPCSLKNMASQWAHKNLTDFDPEKEFNRLDIEKLLTKIPFRKK